MWSGEFSPAGLTAMLLRWWQGWLMHAYVSNNKLQTAFYLMQTLALMISDA